MRKLYLHKFRGLLGLMLMLALSGCGYIEGSASSELIANNISIEDELNVAATSPATGSEEILEATEVVERTQGVESALPLPLCFDFDLGTITDEEDLACDFAFLHGSNGADIEIVSNGEAALASGVLTGEPNPSDCTSREAEKGRSLTLNRTSEPGYLCYLTGEGSHGYLRLLEESVPEANTVGFEWHTFEMDAEVAVPEAPGSMVYENSRLGFKLTLPPSWQGYQVAVHERGQGQTVCFFFEGDQPICVFQIYAFTPSEWDDLEKAPENFYLAENESYIFATDPPGTNCIQMDEFQCDRYREVPKLLAGFSTFN